MLQSSRFQVLLASPDEDLRNRTESLLESLDAGVKTLPDGEALLAAVSGLRVGSVVLLDSQIATVGNGQLLAALHETGVAKRSSIAVISHGHSDKTEIPDPAHAQLAYPEQFPAELWLQRLRDGMIDDIVPRNANLLQWSTHLNTLRRGHLLRSEVEHLRETTLAQAEHDRLTGALNREAILSVLFRETDRVQRMGGSLCVILIDIDDFGHWNSQLGIEACDELLRQISSRIGKLLRSYDLLGRLGNDEFLIALPGCSPVNAVMLAERLRMDVFAMPFDLPSTRVMLTSCFAIASSNGRSPVVVLREAEQTMDDARLKGPDTIRSARQSPFLGETRPGIFPGNRDPNLVLW
uniref:GGDEF domain-containing protein n=1 Tax=mine drainage metagenome TaxID=410659 RepID=E6QK30_9ZZZZ